LQALNLKMGQNIPKLLKAREYFFGKGLEFVVELGDLGVARIENQSRPLLGLRAT
jgi:hypothetical protein